MGIPELKKEITKLKGKRIWLNTSARELLKVVDTYLESAIVEKLQDHKSALTLLGTAVDSALSKEDPSLSLMILGNRIEKLEQALLALAAKLDAENVADIDTNYEATTNSNLI